MGRALEVLSGRATNPGATITGLTVNTGDSLTVKSFPFESPAFITQAWVEAATLGILRIRSARLHDQAQGIRLGPGTELQPLLPDEAMQRIFPQDALTVEITGGGAETDAAALLVYYTDLPGVDARLAMWEEIAPRIINLMGAEQNLTTGGTAGDYGGSQAINADLDTFKRNIDYALLGYTTDGDTLAVGITGPDTGNLRVAGPGSTDAEITRDWFSQLSRRSGQPTIPIINAANVAATTIDVASVATSAARDVNLVFAELAG